MVKQNILFVIWSLETGGAERVVISSARFIDRNRYNPIVCCLNHKGKLAQELEEAGIEVIPLGKGKGLDLSILPKLISLIRRKDITIVHTHLWTSDLWGRLAAIMSRVPVIISTVHNVDSWKPGFFMLIDNILSHFTDKIIAVSDEVKRFYISKVKINEKKIITIYNGVEHDKYAFHGDDKKEVLKEFGLGFDNHVVAIIGRLVEQKNHFIFLEALRLIKKNMPGLKALIIGEGPLKDKIISRVEELGLKENVILTGVRSDVPRLLSIIDIVILSSNYEGLPMIVLESMAAGKVVIATNVGGNPEAIVDGITGFLVPVNDYVSIADKVSFLFEEPRRLEEMSRLARDRALDNFTVAKMLKETQEVYYSVLNSRRA